MSAVDASFTGDGVIGIVGILLGMLVCVDRIEGSEGISEHVVLVDQLCYIKNKEISAPFWWF